MLNSQVSLGEVGADNEQMNEWIYSMSNWHLFPLRHLQDLILFECKNMSEKLWSPPSWLGFTCWSDLHYHRSPFRPRWPPGGHRSSWRPAWGPPAGSDWPPPSFQCPFPTNTGPGWASSSISTLLNNKTKISVPFVPARVFCGWPPSPSWPARPSPPWCRGSASGAACSAPSLGSRCCCAGLAPPSASPGSPWCGTPSSARVKSFATWSGEVNVAILKHAFYTFTHGNWRKKKRKGGERTALNRKVENSKTAVRRSWRRLN